MRRKAIEWEKIFAKDTYDKELLSKIHKKLLQLNKNKTNNPNKKWSKTLTDTSKNIYRWQISLEKDDLHIVSQQGNAS